MEDACLMETLLDLLDEAVVRFGDRPALSIKHDDGTTLAWTYRELDRRTRRRRLAPARPWPRNPAIGS